MRIKILLVCMIVSLSGFKNRTELEEDGILHSEQMAKNVIAAFQHYSSSEFEALFPAIEEFHKMIDENSGLYGKFLEEAKAEFTKSYTRDLKPALRKSFEKVIWDGIERGIEWNTITFVRVEQSKANLQHFDFVPLTIVFLSNGKEYKVNFDKTLVIEGQVKVSQFVKLI